MLQVQHAAQMGNVNFQKENAERSIQKIPLYKEIEVILQYAYVQGIIPHSFLECFNTSFFQLVCENGTHI